MEYIPIEELRLLSRKDTYPRGANAPTVVTRYRCLCGWGKIVERDTPGFNDHFVTLECLICQRKYQPFVDICGDEFVFYPLK